MKISASTCQNATGLGSRCVEVTAILGAARISPCEMSALHVGRCLAACVPGRRLGPPAWRAGQHPESKRGAWAVCAPVLAVSQRALPGCAAPNGPSLAGPRERALRARAAQPGSSCLPAELPSEAADNAPGKADNNQQETGSGGFTSKLRDFIPLEGGGKWCWKLYAK